MLRHHLQPRPQDARQLGRRPIKLKHGNIDVYIWFDNESRNTSLPWWIPMQYNEICFPQIRIVKHWREHHRVRAGIIEELPASASRVNVYGQSEPSGLERNLFE